MIDQPNLDEQPTKKETLRPGWQHYWSMFEANHPPLQIDLLVLPLALHFRYFMLLSHVLELSFPRQMTLLCQLLFLQPHLFCWNKDSEEVSLC